MNGLSNVSRKSCFNILSKVYMSFNYFFSKQKNVILAEKKNIATLCYILNENILASIYGAYKHTYMYYSYDISKPVTNRVYVAITLFMSHFFLIHKPVRPAHAIVFVFITCADSRSQMITMHKCNKKGKHFVLLVLVLFIYTELVLEFQKGRTDLISSLSL